MTVKQIAKRNKVSLSCVYGWIKRAGLQSKLKRGGLCKPAEYSEAQVARIEKMR